MTDPSMVQVSPLLNKLPAELRLEIYRLALTTDGAVTLNKDNTNNHPFPPLLQTCRQVRTEATYLFHTNTFSISCLLDSSNKESLGKDAMTSLRIMGKDNARRLGKLTITVTATPGTAAQIQMACASYQNSKRTQNAIYQESALATLRILVDRSVGLLIARLERTGVLLNRVRVAYCDDPALRGGRIHLNLGKLLQWVCEWHIERREARAMAKAKEDMEACCAWHELLYGGDWVVQP